VATLLLLGFAAVLYWGYVHAGKPAKRKSPQGAKSAHRSAPATDVATRDPHEVLQVPRTATRAQIQKAYRKKVLQYHPDRWANEPPEQQQLAEQRFKEATLAYQALLRDHPVG
jgi:DnaJ-domain-containing protein 1